MRLLCLIGRHRPSSIVSNQGRLFSRCESCDADIIKEASGWRTAPRGFRVIWKEPDSAGSEAAEQPREKPAEKPRRTRRAAAGRGNGGGGSTAGRSKSRTGRNPGSGRRPASPKPRPKK